MDKNVVSILTLLLKTVNIIEDYLKTHDNVHDINVYPPYNEIKNEIYHIYMPFDRKEKLFQMLEKDFSDDVRSQIYLLSILLKCTHDIRIIEQIIRLITSGNLDSYYGSVLEYEIAYELFTHQYEQEISYPLKREIHSFNVNNFKNILQVTEDYQPFHNRNKNRIVVITEQLLDIKHAPSKIILEQCYALNKGLGLDILLFVCPITMSYEDQSGWHEFMRQNYLNELNGDYIIKYEDGKILSAPKDPDGIFYIQYKDAVFRGKQVPFIQEYLQMQKLILNVIKEYNPLFVYNIDSINPIADLCSNFTTVVSSLLSYGYPVSESQVLLYLDNHMTSGDGRSSYSVLEDTKQIAMNMKWHFDIEEPDVSYSKTDFGIEESEFVIAIVGNRLSVEITEEFIQLLESILRIDPRVSIMLIGIFPNPYEKFKNSIFQNRIHSVGYQEKLAAALGAADLFLNPPRIGGGTSALYALYVGVPVITLPDCDVAYNVRNDYVCRNSDEIVETVKKYVADHEYYEQQRKHGIEYTHSLSDLTSIFKTTISHIEEAIIKMEEGDIFED